MYETSSLPPEKGHKKSYNIIKKKEPANYISSLTRFRYTYALSSEVSSPTS